MMNWKTDYIQLHTFQSDMAKFLDHPRFVDRHQIEADGPSAVSFTIGTRTPFNFVRDVDALSTVIFNQPFLHKEFYSYMTHPSFHTVNPDLQGLLQVQLCDDRSPNCTHQEQSLIGCNNVPFAYLVAAIAARFILDGNDPLQGRRSRSEETLGLPRAVGFSQDGLDGSYYRSDGATDRVGAARLVVLAR